jgi:hypothetical protein
MERSISAILAPVLAGNEDVLPIPDFGKGEDPYQGYQVHDYLVRSCSPLHSPRSG